MVLPMGEIQDFPEARFPVGVVTRNLERFKSLNPASRILTSDQWADYLIFKFYPRQRVFFDGRSDFYGRGIGSDYQTLLSARREWRVVLERHRFATALLPLDWPLAAVLDGDPSWVVVDRDQQAVLLVRRADTLKEIRESAECKDVGE
jgi:hypothetical protein